MNDNYNNEGLVELYEVLLILGNFETKEDLLRFINHESDVIRAILQKANQS